MTDKPTIEVERGERLSKVLDRWVKYTGVDIDQKSFMVHMDGRLGDGDIKRNYERVHTAMELDPSYILPATCFRAFFEEYISQLTVTGADMLDPVERAKSMAQIDELGAIRAEISAPIFTDAIKELRDDLEKAASHYECKVEALQKAIEDEASLEQALFMAFKGTEAMPEDWFSKGEYDKEPPKLFKTILSFKNDMEAVHFAAQMPMPFIALAVVYDKLNPIFTHFMFLCKSGENVWMLHDRTEWEHPAQEELISSRRGGIRFWERDKEFAWQFPYGILDKFEGQGDSVISEVPISELDGAETAWLIMVFERIRLKYFEGKYVPKMLNTVISEKPIVIQPAFTKDMKLLAEREGINLLTDGKTPVTDVVTLQTATMKPITRDEVKTDAIGDDFDRKSTVRNRWLEERYEDKVPDSVFNPKQLTEKAGMKLLASGKSELSDMKKSWDVRMGRPEGKFPAMLDLINGKADCEALQCVREDIRSMESVPFGSIEKLQKDARWFARYNKANMIQYYAQEEYNRRKDEVVEWFRATALKNRDHIARWAARGELIAPASKPARGFGDELTDKNIAGAPIYCRKKWPPFNYGWNTAWIVREKGYNECKCFCPVTGAVATIFVIIHLDTADAIALALNTKVSKMPDVLRHYSTIKPYSGNHLLGNIDPIDWCISDPWGELKLGIVVGFSRRGFKKLRKDMGLEPIDPKDMRQGE